MRFYSGSSRPMSSMSFDSFVTDDGRVYKGNYERSGACLGSVHDGYVYDREYPGMGTAPVARIRDDKLYDKDGPENAVFSFEMYSGRPSLSISRYGDINLVEPSGVMDYTGRKLGGIIEFDDSAQGRMRALGMAYLTLKERGELPEITQPKAEEDKKPTVEKKDSRSTSTTKGFGGGTTGGGTGGGETGGGGVGCSKGTIIFLVALIVIPLLIYGMLRDSITQRKILRHTDIMYTGSSVTAYTYKNKVKRIEFEEDVSDSNFYSNFDSVEAFTYNDKKNIQTEKFKAKSDTVAVVTKFDCAYTVQLWVYEPGNIKEYRNNYLIGEYFSPNDGSEAGQQFEVVKGLHYCITVTFEDNSTTHKGHGHILSNIRKKDDLSLLKLNREEVYSGSGLSWTDKLDFVEASAVDSYGNYYDAVQMFGIYCIDNAETPVFVAESDTITVATEVIDYSYTVNLWDAENGKGNTSDHHVDSYEVLCDAGLTTIQFKAEKGRHYVVSIRTDAQGVLMSGYGFVTSK